MDVALENVPQRELPKVQAHGEGYPETVRQSLRQKDRVRKMETWTNSAAALFFCDSPVL